MICCRERGDKLLRIIVRGCHRVPCGGQIVPDGCVIWMRLGACSQSFYGIVIGSKEQRGDTGGVIVVSDGLDDLGCERAKAKMSDVARLCVGRDWPVRETAEPRFGEARVELARRACQANH